jgi:hypothetical protein
MRAFLVVLLVLGLALVAFGVLGILGAWWSDPPPAPGEAIDTGPVSIGGGTITVTRIYEDGGTIGFAALALLGVLVAFLAWRGESRARPRA